MALPIEGTNRPDPTPNWAKDWREVAGIKPVDPEEEERKKRENEIRAIVASRQAIQAAPNPEVANKVAALPPPNQWEMAPTQSPWNISDEEEETPPPAPAEKPFSSIGAGWGIGAPEAVKAFSAWEPPTWSGTWETVKNVGQSVLDSAKPWDDNALLPYPMRVGVNIFEDVTGIDLPSVGMPEGIAQKGVELWRQLWIDEAEEEKNLVLPLKKEPVVVEPDLEWVRKQPGFTYYESQKAEMERQAVERRKAGQVTTVGKIAGTTGRALLNAFQLTEALGVTLATTPLDELVARAILPPEVSSAFDRSQAPSLGDVLAVLTSPYQTAVSQTWDKESDKDWWGNAGGIRWLTSADWMLTKEGWKNVFDAPATYAENIRTARSLAESIDDEELRNEASIGLYNVFGGSSTKTVNAVINRDAEVAALFAQADQAAAAGDMESAARLSLQANEKANKPLYQIVDDNANILFEMVGRAAFSADNVIPIGKLFTVGNKSLGYVWRGVLKATQAKLPTTADDAVRVMKAAMDLPSVKRLLDQAAGVIPRDDPTFIRRLLDLGEYTNATKAYLLEDGAIRTASQIFRSIASGADAKVILKALATNPGQLVSQATPLASSPIWMQQGAKLSPQLLGNPEFVRTLPVWQLADEALQKLPSVNAETFDYNQFMAEVYGALHESAYKLYGVADQAAEANTFVRIVGDSSGKHIVEKYTKDKKGVETVIQKSGLLKLSDARKIAEDWTPALKSANPLVQAWNFQNAIVKGIMTDSWLIVRPANWIKNGVGGTIQLMGEDAYAITTRAQTIDDLGTVFGPGSLRLLEDLFGGGVKAGILSEQPLHWTSRVPVLKGKAFDSYRNFIERASQIPYGNTWLGNMPFGEEALHLTAVHKVGMESFGAAWEPLTQDLTNWLIQKGWQPDQAKAIGDQAKVLWKLGKNEMAARLQELAQLGHFQNVLTQMGVTPGDISTKALTQLLDIQKQIGKVPLEELALQVDNVFDEMMFPLVHAIDINPPHLGNFSWTVADDAKDYAWFGDELITSLINATNGKMPSSQRLKAVNQFIAGLNKQVDTARNALLQDAASGAKVDPNRVVQTMMDYWEQRSLLRQAIDKNGADTIAAMNALRRQLANKEITQSAFNQAANQLWMAKFNFVRAQMEKFGNDVTKIFTDTRAAIADPNAPPVQIRWGDGLPDFFNADIKKLQQLADLGLQVGAAGQNPAAFQQALQAIRALTDQHIYDVFVEFQRNPTLRNMDIFMDVIRRADIMGAQARGHLDDVMKRVNGPHTDKSGKVLGEKMFDSWDDYYDYRNRLWRQYPDAVGKYAQAMIMKMREENIFGLALKNLKWEDPDLGEFIVNAYEGNGVWILKDMAGNVLRAVEEGAQTADISSQVGTVIPQTIVDEWKGFIADAAKRFEQLRKGNVPMDEAEQILDMLKNPRDRRPIYAYIDKLMSRLGYPGTSDTGTLMNATKTLENGTQVKVPLPIAHAWTLLGKSFETYDDLSLPDLRRLVELTEAAIRQQAPLRNLRDDVLGIAPGDLVYLWDDAAQATKMKDFAVGLEGVSPEDLKPFKMPELPTFKDFKAKFKWVTDRIVMPDGAVYMDGIYDSPNGPITLRARLLSADDAALGKKPIRKTVNEAFESAFADLRRIFSEDAATAGQQAVAKYKQVATYYIPIIRQQMGGKDWLADVAKAFTAEGDWPPPGPRLDGLIQAIGQEGYDALRMLVDSLPPKMDGKILSARDKVFDILRETQRLVDVPKQWKLAQIIPFQPKGGGARKPMDYLKDKFVFENMTPSGPKTRTVSRSLLLGKEGQGGLLSFAERLPTKEGKIISYAPGEIIGPEAEDIIDWFDLGEGETLFDAINNAMHAIPDGQRPMPVSDAIYDQMVRLRNIRDRFKQGMTTLQAQPVKPYQHLALNEGLKTLLRRYDDVAAISIKVAKEAADRGMLDFNMKRGFDALLSNTMTFPYYWSRSGVNWARRIKYKPYLLSAYYQMQHAQQQENQQAGVIGTRWENTWPNPLPFGPERISDPLDWIFSYSTMLPNQYYPVEDGMSGWERYYNQARQVYSLYPQQAYAIAWLGDMLDPKEDGTKRIDEFNLGGIVGQYRIADTVLQTWNKNQQYQLGPIKREQYGFLSGTDQWTDYRIATQAAVEAYNASKDPSKPDITPEIAQYAQQIAYNIEAGKERTEGVPPEFVEQAEEVLAMAVRNRSLAELIKQATGYLFAVSFINRDQAEVSLRNQAAEYRGLGYSPENPYGSKEAKTLFLESNPYVPVMWTRAGPDEEFGGPAQSAQTSQWYAERIAIFEQMSRDVEALLAQNPDATNDEIYAINEAYRPALEAIDEKYPLAKKNQPSTVGMTPYEYAVHMLGKVFSMEMEGKPEYPEDGTPLEMLNYYVAKGVYDTKVRRAKTDIIRDLLQEGKPYDIMAVNEPPGWKTILRQLVQGKYVSDLERQYNNRYAGELKYTRDEYKALESEFQNELKETQYQLITEVLGQEAADIGRYYSQIPKENQESRKAYSDANPILYSVWQLAYHPEEYEKGAKLFGPDWPQVINGIPKWLDPEEVGEKEAAARDAERDAYKAMHPTYTEASLWYYGRYGKYQEEEGQLQPDYGKDYEEALQLWGSPYEFKNIFELLAARSAAYAESKETGHAFDAQYPDAYEMKEAYWAWYNAFSEGNLDALPQPEDRFDLAPTPDTYTGERPYGSGEQPIVPGEPIPELGPDWANRELVEWPPEAQPAVSGVQASLLPGQLAKIPGVNPEAPEAAAPVTAPTTEIVAPAGVSKLFSEKAPVSEGDYPDDWEDWLKLSPDYKKFVESNKKSEEWQARRASVGAEWGNEYLALWDAYFDLPKGEARTEYRNRNPIIRAMMLSTYNPAEYAAVTELFGQEAVKDWAYAPAYDGTEAGNQARRDHWDAYPGAFLVYSWLNGRPRNDNESEKDDGFEYNFGKDYAKAEELFGGDIWQIVSMFKRSWDSATRRAFYQQYPKYTEWRDWWYGQLPQTLYNSYTRFAYGGYGGYGGGGWSWSEPYKEPSGSIYVKPIYSNAPNAFEVWTPPGGWGIDRKSLGPTNINKWRVS